jgi:DNA-binding winged helix-turn-helix (wHTH) protein
MPVSRLCAFGPYRLDFERRLLLRGDEIIALQQKALEILIVLVERQGEVVSKDELMKSVWPDSFVEESNLTQNVFVLRRALGEGPKENRYIATVPGRGYRFVGRLDDISEHKQAPQEEPCPDGRTHSSLGSRRNFVRALMVSILAAVLLAGIAWSHSNFARYCNNRGALRQQAGDLSAAVADYQWALRLSPGYAEAHYNLADVYDEIPDYRKALEEYQRAIDADPTFYPAYNNLARLLIMKSKDCEAALRLIDRAMRLGPQERTVRYSLYKNYGWANVCLGQFGQAEQDLRSAVGVDPLRGPAHCLMAKVLEKQSRTQRQLEEWEACLAFSNQPDVEPEWRNEAREHLMTKNAAALGRRHK